MKKIVIFILVLTCLVSTTWAAPGSFTSKIKLTNIPVEISANGLPLADLLVLLSDQSGISMMATPEVAGMKINLQIIAQESLEDVLAALCKNNQLQYRLNEKKNTVIILKGSEYAEQWNVSSPSVMYKANLYEQSQPCIRVTPAMTGYNRFAAVTGFEEYNRIYDNSYQDTLGAPVSTFSIDVDTASYSNVRRIINSGKLPQPDAVRTEEMINYFTYNYQQPVDDHPFSVTTEVSACPWYSGHQLIMIGLQGKKLKLAELPAGNLVFLIDVSGSMATPNKLPLLKTAFKMMVKELREQDKVAIVGYAGQAGIVLEPTPGDQKDKIINAIDKLEAGGSTAGSEGIKLAYKIAKENYNQSGNNRVILATDGDFNVGVSSEGELTRLIEERRNDGVFFSVIGVGSGNIKDSKMEMLADKGNGYYAYVDNAQEASRVMVGQLAGTLFTIAKDVKLQVEFNPAKVKQYRLIGYENRIMDKRDFNDDKKDAGDMGAGHSVTALYEVVPWGSEEKPESSDPLIYQHAEIVPSDELFQVKIRYKKPNANISTVFAKHVGAELFQVNPSEDFKFVAAVAEYSMLLRNSEFKGQASYQQVIDLATSAKGIDTDGYRSEFIRMAKVSQLMDER